MALLDPLWITDVYQPLWPWLFKVPSTIWWWQSLKTDWQTTMLSLVNLSSGYFVPLATWSAGIWGQQIICWYLEWSTFDNIHNCCEYIHQICISNIIAKNTISSKQFFHPRLGRKTFSKLCKLKRGRRWKRSQLKRWAISLDESAPNALNWTQLLTTFSFENNEERENLARAPI